MRFFCRFLEVGVSQHFDLGPGIFFKVMKKISKTFLFTIFHTYIIK